MSLFEIIINIVIVLGCIAFSIFSHLRTNEVLKRNEEKYEQTKRDIEKLNQ